MTAVHRNTRITTMTTTNNTAWRNAYALCVKSTSSSAWRNVMQRALMVRGGMTNKGKEEGRVQTLHGDTRTQKKERERRTVQILKEIRRCCCRAVPWETRRRGGGENSSVVASYPFSYLLQHSLSLSLLFSSFLFFFSLLLSSRLVSSSFRCLFIAHRTHTLGKRRRRRRG